MVKDFLKETFNYSIDKFKKNKSAIMKILSISVFLASVTSYWLVKYVAPGINERMSKNGVYEVKYITVGLLIIMILFILSIFTLFLDVVIAFVLGYLKPFYFTVGLLLLSSNMFYISLLGSISVLMFINMVLSYIILVLSVRDLFKFVFHRKILV